MNPFIAAALMIAGISGMVGVLMSLAAGLYTAIFLVCLVAVIVAFVELVP